MLLSPSDLTRLGLFKSYSALRSACTAGKLAEPYRLPGGQPRWEGRAVLAAIGASPDTPAEPPLNNRGESLPGNELASCIARPGGKGSHVPIDGLALNALQEG